MSNQTVNLFSGLLVHHMGQGLADGITQGSAGPDEFRTAPLWGVGSASSFSMMDALPTWWKLSRTTEVGVVEANKVIERFNQVSAQEQQDVINLLRSL